MKPCWRERGLTDKGAKMADEALPAIQALVDRFGGVVVQVALDEAAYRRHDLPLCSAAWQKQYLKDNE